LLLRIFIIYSPSRKVIANRKADAKIEAKKLDVLLKEQLLIGRNEDFASA
jgi:hypothetical protein